MQELGKLRQEDDYRVRPVSKVGGEGREMERKKKGGRGEKEGNKESSNLKKKKSSLKSRSEKNGNNRAVKSWENIKFPPHTCDMSSKRRKGEMKKC